MTQLTGVQLQEGLQLGTSFSDCLFAYRKDASRLLKEAGNDFSVKLKLALEVAEKRLLISKTESKSLQDCCTATVKLREGNGELKKTMILLQNSLAKALIAGKASNFYLSCLNLCLGLVREGTEAEFLSTTTLPVSASAKRSRPALAQSVTYPGGSGQAILIGAIIGGSIGGDLGGPLGALIGGVVGALVGTSTDATVIAPDPQ